MYIPWITLVGGELLSELPSTSPLVSDDEGGDGWLGLADWGELFCEGCENFWSYIILEPLYPELSSWLFKLQPSGGCVLFEEATILAPSKSASSSVSLLLSEEAKLQKKLNILDYWIILLY